MKTNMIIVEADSFVHNTDVFRGVLHSMSMYKCGYTKLNFFQGS